jgi:hypothetical protein
MRIVLSSSKASRVCDWSCYALFRDNAQHFIENGRVTPRFAALHSIEQAITNGVQSVNAARLRGEVLGAIFALGKLSIADAAISVRSRAIMTGNRRAPLIRGTVQANRVGWQLPIEAPGDANLLQLLKPFATAVLVVTDKAVDGDVIEVRREGRAPAFATDDPADDAQSGGAGLPSLGLAGLLLACQAVAAAAPSTVSNATEADTRRAEPRVLSTLPA